MSETNRVTDEGSYNDESSVIEQPLTTACGGGPKGEALIGYDVISSEVEKSPEIETKTIVHDYRKYPPAEAPCLVCACSAPDRLVNRYAQVARGKLQQVTYVDEHKQTKKVENRRVGRRV